MFMIPLTWLALTGFFFDLSANRAYGSDFNLSQRIGRVANFQLKQPLKELPKSVVYGNEGLGYFRTEEVRISPALDRLAVRLIPPSYSSETVFFLETASGGWLKLGKRRFTSAIPGKYQGQCGQLQGDPLKSPFYLLGGALHVGKFHDPLFFAENHKAMQRPELRYGFAVICNRLAEPVWLHVPHLKKAVISSHIIAKPLPNAAYGLMFSRHKGLFQVIGAYGKVRVNLPLRSDQPEHTVHHDFYLEDGRLLTFSSRGQPSPGHPHGDRYLSDYLIAVDLKNQQVDEVYGFEKDFPPASTQIYFGLEGAKVSKKKQAHFKVNFDAFHANALEWTEHGFLVSLRNLNKILLMSHDLKKILWTVGRDATDTYTIEDKKDWFSHAHTPRLVHKDTLVLFDNGIESRRSRIVAYGLNKKGAELIWQWQPKKPLFASNRSSVALVPGTKHTYAAYFVGVQEAHQDGDPPKGTFNLDVLVEFDAQSGRELSRLRRRFFVLTPGYRAIPIPSVGFEKPLSDLPNGLVKLINSGN